MAAPELAARYPDFPDGLHEAPVLLPDPGSTMRRLLEDWFRTLAVRPRVIGEFEDSALLKSFGQEGAGLFPVPSLVADEVEAQYDVHTLGELDGIRERFYAIHRPGKETNPAVSAVLRVAWGALDHSSE